MHEKKKFSLKKKLTTTSLLGPRISCHFCISSSSSKGVSFIPWKTQYKVLVLYTKQHERQICDKQLTASNATSISNYLQSTNVVFETPPPPPPLKNYQQHPCQYFLKVLVSVVLTTITLICQMCAQYLCWCT